MTTTDSISTTLTKKERFLRSIEHKPIDRLPVWLMRQAGRYMQEYQEVKKRYTFLEMCRIPEVAAEVSLQPFHAFDVDAIIVFNDILIPLEAMGRKVEFLEGGPQVVPALRDVADAKQLQPAPFDEQPQVFDSIQTIRKAVGDDVPILGFAGAPFTMATYLVEGKMSKNLRYIKEMVYSQPDVLHGVLETITKTVIDYLKIQIAAGANAVQIFDTWGGSLAMEEYLQFALPYQKTVIEEISKTGVPITLYVNGSAPFIEAMDSSGASVLSVDWRLPLADVTKRLSRQVCLQGNLDPTVLYAPVDKVINQTHKLLRGIERNTGYIVNLGHGILPETPVESVRAFVKTVQEFRLP